MVGRLFHGPVRKGRKKGKENKSNVSALDAGNSCAALLGDCEERGRDELLILCLCVDEVGEWVSECALR